jgi:polysaccharide export outer membrane protein
MAISFSNRWYVYCASLPIKPQGHGGLRERKMVVTRYLAPVFAAILVTACSTAQQSGTFSTSTVGGPRTARADTQGLKTSAPNTQNGEAQQDATARDRDTAIQKVALTLSSVSDPSNKAYVIGPRDVLEISVFKVPELSKTVQVSEVGTVSYPLVGDVQASGRTARQVEQDLTKSLGAKYLQNPQITVSVREYNSQRITMDGAFKRSGVVPLAGGLTLLQATANAGGFDINADETVILFRQANGGRSETRHDVGRIREGKDPDVPLEAGDVLIAPTSTMKEGMNTVFKFLPLATLAVPYL